MGGGGGGGGGNARQLRTRTTQDVIIAGATSSGAAQRRFIAKCHPNFSRLYFGTSDNYPLSLPVERARARRLAELRLYGAGTPPFVDER